MSDAIEASVATPLPGSPEEAEPPKEWRPSQFNARAIAEDGTLLVWNSFTNAFSGFPPVARNAVEQKLRPGGFTDVRTGLTKYLADRGFLVGEDTNELARFRFRYGRHHYRQDLLDLTVMASDDCNFRCVYCYEKFERGTMEPWVRSATIRLVERRAPTLNKLYTSYFGGEPLLGYDAIAELAPAFLHIADKYDLEYKAGITTNGYLLTPEVSQALLKWRITRYQVTLDGLPADHDSRRMLKNGGPTFHRILDNLSAMHRYKDDFRVLLRVNFDQASATRMREFVELLQPFGSDERFVLFFYPIAKLGSKNDSTLNVCGDRDPARTNLETLAREMGMRVERTTASRPFGVPCYANDPYHVIVGVDGKLMKCTVMLDSGPQNVVGKLKDDGTAHTDLDKYAAWCVPHFEDDPVCQRCFFLPACAGASCPVSRVVHKQRRCPPDKGRIKTELIKLWRLNHMTANRYDLATQQLTPCVAPAALEATPPPEA